MLSLTIINSDNICNVFNLDSSPGSSYTLGRSADCDIALTNEMHLSRIHCILTVGMGCVLITDNNSSNGIYEDDNRVSEIIALPGKVYRIGNCNLSIEYKADEQPQEPSPEVSDSAQEDYVDAEEHHPSHRDYYEDEPRHRSHHSHDRDYYEEEPRHRSRHSHDRDYYEDEPRHRSHHSHDRDYYEDEPRHRSHHAHDRDYYEDEPRHRSRHAHDRDYYEEEPRHRSHRSHDRDYYEDEPRHRSHRSHERDYYEEEPRHRSHRSPDRDYYEDEHRQHPHTHREQGQHVHHVAHHVPAPTHHTTNIPKEQPHHKTAPHHASGSQAIPIHVNTPPSREPHTPRKTQAVAKTTSIAPAPQQTEAQPVQLSQPAPQPQLQKPKVLKLLTPGSNDPSSKRKFVPPPPRKALVKRAAPRPFYTAAGKLNTETEIAPPKELKHRRPVGDVRIIRPPSMPASELGLPSDFELNLSLLNTTETLEEGDLLRFGVSSDTDCYLYLIQYDSEKQGVLLLPGVGGAHNKIPAQTEVQLPPPGDVGTYEIYVEPPFGTDTILAIACSKNVDFGKFWSEYLAQADALTPIGDTERRVINHCRTLKDMENTLWASAILYIQTGS